VTHIHRGDSWKDIETAISYIITQQVHAQGQRIFEASDIERIRPPTKIRLDLYLVCVTNDLVGKYILFPIGCPINNKGTSVVNHPPSNLIQLHHPQQYTTTHLLY
jgi:hypothetical protein